MKKYGHIYADIMPLHDEVTGSCHLVVVKLPGGKTIRFIVDCGLFQEEQYSKLNHEFPFNADCIDFALITHVHVDHIGRLPLLARKGFSNEIYATEATCKLLPLALKDSFKILSSSAKRSHTKPLYSEGDINKVLSCLSPCRYNKPIKIGDHIKVTFLQNGHLVGSSMILVQIMDYGSPSINLLFTGDYNDKNTFFEVSKLPKWILNLPLTVIQEATYGDTDSQEVTSCFKANISECLKEGGTVIAPVFSLGRSQEILHELKQMQDNGELSESIPIYLDGKLAIKYTTLYAEDELDVSEDMKDFMPQNLTFLDKISRQDVLKDEGVKIVLTTSGMGSYGPAQRYIPEYIGRKGAMIHFTGYTAEGTLGNRLKTASQGDMVNVGGMVVKKQARVEYTMEYSAHAKADEMLAFLKQFQNLKLVLINHGEEAAKAAFAERVLDEVCPTSVGIMERSYFFRVSHYGLEKTMPTKF